MAKSALSTAVALINNRAVQNSEKTHIASFSLELFYQSVPMVHSSVEELCKQLNLAGYTTYLNLDMQTLTVTWKT